MAVGFAGYALNKLSSIFFKINRPNIVGNNRVGFVRFTAFLSEENRAELEVTDFPIESGASVADHAIFKPRELVINATASNTPMQFFGGVGNIIDQATNIFSNFSTDWETVPTNARRQWQNLISLLYKRTLVNITTVMEVYENMMLVSVVSYSDDTTGGDLFVEMRFKEVIIVDTRKGISSLYVDLENKGLYDKTFNSKYGSLSLLDTTPAEEKVIQNIEVAESGK